MFVELFDAAVDSKIWSVDPNRKRSSRAALKASRDSSSTRSARVRFGMAKP